MSLSTPFVLAALFIYKASGFSKFNDFAKGLVPLPSVQKILGLDNDFLNSVINVVKTLYKFIEQAINSIADAFLSLPKEDSDISRGFRNQFTGCSITLIFLV